MFVPLLFDPSSGTIIWNRDLLPHGETGKIIEGVIECGLLGLDEYAIDVINTLPDKERIMGIDFLSAVWHEKRHFADWLVTNYGAFRYRSFLEVYLNCGPLLGEGKNKRLALPLYLNNDPVYREFYDLDKPSADIEPLIKSLGERHQWYNDDSVSINAGGFLYRISGDTMFEALGYQTQNFCMLQAFGGKANRDWFESGKERISYPVYRWMEIMLIKGGLAKSIEEGAGLLSVRVPLYFPLLYASLAIETKSENIDALLSSSRFALIFTELQTRLKSVRHPANTTEAWKLVNEICKDLFGKSAIESMEEDIAFTEQLILKIKSAGPYIYPPLVATAISYHSLRKSLFQQFQQNPDILFDEKLFYNNTLPRLLPMPVYIRRFGFHTEQQIDSYCYWKKEITTNKGVEEFAWGWSPKTWPSAASEVTNNTIVLKSHENWQEVVDTISPVGRILANGYQDPTLMGPEMVNTKAMLRRMGCNFYVPFEKSTSKPNLEKVIESFQYLTQLSTLKCDFCSKPLMPKQIRIVSPIEIREDAELDAKARHYLGIDGYNMYSALDWSYWMIHINGCPDTRTGVRLPHKLFT